MDAKIDYISFTLPDNLSGVGHGKEINDRIAWQLHTHGCDALFDLLPANGVEQRGGRKIYGCGLFCQASNLNIWWGGVANHILVEISGVGCQMLRDLGAMETVLAGVQKRTTRIDVAVDLTEAGKPAEFVAYKMENRFSVTETQDTETGWTQYVGSRKSERFARVYLYKPPHPRAGVMRVEHVLRSEYAKTIAARILKNGLAEVVSSLGLTFGWRSPHWKPSEVTDGKLKAQRHDKESASTLRWLARQVAPALIKAHRSGLIDVETWFTNHVLGEIEDQPETANSSRKSGAASHSASLPTEGTS